MESNHSTIQERPEETAPIEQGVDENDDAWETRGTSSSMSTTTSSIMSATASPKRLREASPPPTTGGPSLTARRILSSIPLQEFLVRMPSLSSIAALEGQGGAEPSESSSVGDLSSSLHTSGILSAGDEGSICSDATILTYPEEEPSPENSLTTVPTTPPPPQNSSSRHTTANTTGSSYKAIPSSLQFFFRAGRRVGFAKYAEIQEIEHRHDVSKDEASLYWYAKDDYLTMKQKRQRDEKTYYKKLKESQSGQTRDTLELNQACCGLETPRDSQLRATIVTQSVRSVLLEQECQRFERDPAHVKAERIADVYLESSIANGWDARDRAVQLEEAIQDYLVEGQSRWGNETGQGDMIPPRSRSVSPERPLVTREENQDEGVSNETEVSKLLSPTPSTLVAPRRRPSLQPMGDDQGIDFGIIDFDEDDDSDYDDNDDLHTSLNDSLSHFEADQEIPQKLPPPMPIRGVGSSCSASPTSSNSSGSWSKTQHSIQQWNASVAL